MENIIRKRRKKALKDMTLMDDTLMNHVFNDAIIACEQLLLPIINNKNLNIIQCISQSPVESVYGKGVRFDVLAKDKNGRLYDIEMQKNDHYASALRARLYSSMLDNKMLSNENKVKDKHMLWESLSESYVIFFTSIDHFKGNKALYHIDRYVKELAYVPFNDFQHIIYVNCSYNEESSEIGKLIHDLKQSDPNCMFNKVLADRVKYIKEDREGGKLMSEAMERNISEWRKEDRLEGSKEERINSIRSVLSYLHRNDPSLSSASLILSVSEILSIDKEEVKKLIIENGLISIA